VWLVVVLGSPGGCRSGPTRGGVQPDARVTAFGVVVGEDPRVGPWSLVMSQFQISSGRVASSSGRFFAGCVSWARRSLEEPLLANFPCNS
jgi:hypothetical protein